MRACNVAGALVRLDDAPPRDDREVRVRGGQRCLAPHFHRTQLGNVPLVRGLGAKGPRRGRVERHPHVERSGDGVAGRDGRSLELHAGVERGRRDVAVHLEPGGRARVAQQRLRAQDAGRGNGCGRVAFGGAGDRFSEGDALGGLGLRAQRRGTEEQCQQHRTPRGAGVSARHVRASGL
jgi:hypothetical protein